MSQNIKKISFELLMAENWAFMYALKWYFRQDQILSFSLPKGLVKMIITRIIILISCTIIANSYIKAHLYFSQNIQ